MSKPLRSEDGFLYRCPRSDALIVVGRCPDPIILPPPPPPPPTDPRYNLLVSTEVSSGGSPRGLAEWFDGGWILPNGADLGLPNPSRVLSAVKRNGHILMTHLTFSPIIGHLTHITPGGTIEELLTWDGTTGDARCHKSNAWPDDLMVIGSGGFSSSGPQSYRLEVGDAVLVPGLVPLSNITPTGELGPTRLIEYAGAVFALLLGGERIAQLSSSGVWQDFTPLPPGVPSPKKFGGLGSWDGKLVAAVRSTGASGPVDEIWSYNGSSWSDITGAYASHSGAAYLVGLGTSLFSFVSATQAIQKYSGGSWSTYVAGGSWYSVAAPGVKSKEKLFMPAILDSITGGAALQDDGAGGRDEYLSLPGVPPSASFWVDRPD